MGICAMIILIPHLHIYYTMKISLRIHSFICMILLIRNKCYFEYYSKYVGFTELFLPRFFFFALLDIKIRPLLYLPADNSGKMDENKTHANIFLYTTCLR